MSRKIYLPVLGIWEDIDDVTLLNGVPKVASDGSLVDSSGAPVSVAAAARFPSVAVSGASISLTSIHIGKMVRVTTGASDSAVSLPASATNGDTLITAKADTGAGKVNISSDTAWLIVQDDVVQWVYNGSAWAALDWRISPVRQVFTATGVYTSFPLSRYVYAKLIGGGAGAGGGRKGAAGSVRCGGGGGQAGGYSERLFPAGLLGAPLTQVPVTIGAAGVGGAAQTANSTNGNSGVSGSATSFGTLLVAQGGAAGVGGTTSSGYGGSNNGVGTINAIAGAAGSTTGGAGAQPAAPGAISASGSSGAGITSGNVDSAGAAGRSGGRMGNDLASSAAGSSAGGNGADGQSQPTDFSLGFFGGSAGGSGGSSLVGNGGNGGKGGWPGGGGSGGGAAVDSVGDAGAGGDGADGAAEIITLF